MPLPAELASVFTLESWHGLVCGYEDPAQGWHTVMDVDVAMELHAVRDLFRETVGMSNHDSPFYFQVCVNASCERRTVPDLKDIDLSQGWVFDGKPEPGHKSWVKQQWLEAWADYLAYDFDEDRHAFINGASNAWSEMERCMQFALRHSASEVNHAGWASLDTIFDCHCARNLINAVGKKYISDPLLIGGIVACQGFKPRFALFHDSRMIEGKCSQYLALQGPILIRATQGWSGFPLLIFDALRPVPESFKTTYNHGHLVHYTNRPVAKSISGDGLCLVKTRCLKTLLLRMLLTSLTPTSALLGTGLKLDVLITRAMRTYICAIAMEHTSRMERVLPFSSTWKPACSSALRLGRQLEAIGSLRSAFQAN